MFSSLRSSGSISAAVLGLALFGCTLSRPEYVSPNVAVGSPAFMRTMEAHTLSGPVEGNRVDVLLNGDEIFPAMLAAVRGAQKTITFANFVYEPGEISRELAEAMAERCRAGVEVNVLLDAVGSAKMAEPDRDILLDAGCHLALYRPCSRSPSAASTTAITVASWSSMAGSASREASASAMRGRATDASEGVGGRPTSGWRAPSCVPCRPHSLRHGGMPPASC